MKQKISSAARLVRQVLAFALFAATLLPLAQAQSPSASAEAPTKTLGVVTITAGQPTSLPTQIPTTMEGSTQEQIEKTVNATDSQDAIKYFPSLLVRKRYVGDYNHAVLSSRASGTGNSARSAVYADGILLSNYLGNGATYTPRWGMVTPEQIERVDVMYGPFSAAYAGNSVGAVVDYVTRMPQTFEAHAKVSGFLQPFKLYNTDTRYQGRQTSASLGNKSGDWSWWLSINSTDSEGQPLVFVTRTLASGTPGNTGTPVTGAVPGQNSRNQDWFILGTTTQYRTRQDHMKVKLAYDITPTVRAHYVLGYWQNDAQARPQSYLRDTAGREVYSGPINLNGRSYTLAATDFSASNEKLEHWMHGLSVKSRTQGTWDWEVAVSRYDYGTDQARRSTSALPNALNGGSGIITDQNGTGWNTLALKGIWRPQGVRGAHVVDFGYQQENYRLRLLQQNISGNWLSDPGGSLNTDAGGKAQLRSLYAQDTWSFAPRWKTVLGLRAEQWQANNGFTRKAAQPNSPVYAAREETHLSPKAALSWQWNTSTVLKASLGRAVRMPTVQELYGNTSTGNSQFINDPQLKPEKSWTSELSAEKDLGNGLLRVTLFSENVRDALYSQTSFDSVANLNITRVQNVGRIQTHGLELAYNANDIWARGFDLGASLTYARSRIKENQGFVTTPGDTLGKRQPRVPDWRATVLASYRFNERWDATYAMRYSGKQYNTLDNSDPNGSAYQGTSRFFTTDLRVRYQIAKQWSAALGIDNLNNYQYWNFHPYPQRSYSLELKFDL
ncbi:MAG: TonB-dependent receptor [Burkholderiales bacterium]|jgi:iron complex outermembrane receptor protein